LSSEVSRGMLKRAWGHEDSGGGLARENQIRWLRLEWVQVGRLNYSSARYSVLWRRGGDARLLHDAGTVKNTNGCRHGSKGVRNLGPVSAYPPKGGGRGES